MAKEQEGTTAGRGKRPRAMEEGEKNAREEELKKAGENDVDERGNIVCRWWDANGELILGGPGGRRDLAPWWEEVRKWRKEEGREYSEERWAVERRRGVGIRGEREDISDVEVAEGNWATVNKQRGGWLDERAGVGDVRYRVAPRHVLLSLRLPGEKAWAKRQREREERERGWKGWFRKVAAGEEEGVWIEIGRPKRAKVEGK